MDGLLIVDKEPSLTSYQVVDLVKRNLNVKKVGHCGTLDPMATGLLIIVLGKATKLQDRLMSEDKIYQGSMTLGVETSSYDADGKVISTHKVPELSNEEIEQVFKGFTGDFEQIPPMFSAIKKDGVRLYKLARQGKEVTREPRKVHVKHHQIDEIYLPIIDFTICCSRGFYVRSYAHDIGKKLSCGAYLSRLKRLQSGDFNLERSISVEEIKTGDWGIIEGRFFEMEELLTLL